MQSRFWMDKTKGLSPNHVSVQKSRWPYSMQSKFGMDKYRGDISWSGYMALGYIFTSPKKVMCNHLHTNCRLKAYMMRI